MRKLIYSLAFLLISFQSFSQITVTESVLPKAGDSWVYHNIGNVSILNLTPPSDTPRVWKYNSPLLQTYGPNPTLYLNASSVINAVLFPPSSIATTLADFATFYSEDSTGLYCVGYYDSSQDSALAATTYNPPDLIVPTPFTYKSVRSIVTKSITISYNTPNSKYYKDYYTLSQTFIADSYGTLSTPATLNAPVIRVNSPYKQTDSLFWGDDLSTLSFNSLSVVTGGKYYFLTNESNVIVMELDYDSSPDSLTWGSYYEEPFSFGIDKTEMPQVFTNIFPNPTPSNNITITISGEQAHDLKIYNIDGRCIETENVEGITNLHISNCVLVSGIYLYRITDRLGNPLCEKKFMVE